MDHVAFSPDGSRIASIVDNWAYLWDAATGKRMGMDMNHQERISKIEISPDGERIATLSFDGTVALWDAWSGLAIGSKIGSDDKRLGPLRKMISLAFTPDSDRLVLGSTNGVKLFDAKTGEEIRGLCIPEKCLPATLF